MAEIAGCGGGGARVATPRAGGSASNVDAGSASGAIDAGADAADAWTTLDELAARAPSVAAGMREAKRDELASSGALTFEVAKASAADLCARVSFVATIPVHAWLEDARGNALADGATSARALLASRGPVCVRKGDAIVLRAEARDPFRVRVVAWTSP
jgi:hypothetical protein